MKLFLVSMAGLGVVLFGNRIRADEAKPPAKAAPQAIEFFEGKVRPLLVDKCISCHGSEKQRGGLRLDSRTALLKGGDNGPIVTTGDPEKSPMIHAVRYDGETKMPPKDKLPADAVATLTTWVKMGLPYPDSAGNKPVKTDNKAIAEVRKSHWSFQPVKKHEVPKVKNAAWVQTPVDAFILAKLEAKGMTPAKPADRRTLLRRITFDMIGLPPTPEEVAAFEADISPDAFAKVVDRLLASPQYGERWGRHWLDVARYADTKGYVFEEERRYPFAYTYRDYVIRAFNEDLPYDQFILQQLAADRLPLGEGKRPLSAMGYLTLGRRFLNNTADIIDDRIDVVTRGLLGLTVTCARCHDHKFDPIPTKDYYSLYGVFSNSEEPKELPEVGTPERTPAFEAYEKELKKLEKDLAEYQEKHKEELKAKNQKIKREQVALRNKIDHLKATNPAAPPRAMALQDLPKVHEPQVFLRGNPNNRGEQVPRQFLLVLAGDQRQPFHEGSGRLELARAIATKDNPLTARVLVNRVWLHHFGAGLVRTPSDFGLRGEQPTHPELLDYLAARFMEEGWSIKKLHRLIVLSNAYQQSSDATSELREIDPENRLLSHMNRQRLDFEEMRDALLFVAGKLDLKVGGPAMDITSRPFARRRTVYGFIDRQNLPGMFRTFDFASPDTSNPQRFTTTVPQQALFLMNSPFVEEQAKNLVSRNDVNSLGETASKIKRLYQLAYSRWPDADELALGQKFIEANPGEKSWEEFAQVLLLANEFAFVD
jgi:mono/diheme cytochrome c family protein